MKSDACGAGVPATPGPLVAAGPRRPPEPQVRAPPALQAKEHGPWTRAPWLCVGCLYDETLGRIHSINSCTYVHFVNNRCVLGVSDEHRGHARPESPPQEEDGRGLSSYSMLLIGKSLNFILTIWSEIRLKIHTFSRDKRKFGNQNESDDHEQDDVESKSPSLSRGHKGSPTSPDAL